MERKREAIIYGTEMWQRQEDKIKRIMGKVQLRKKVRNLLGNPFS